MGVSHPSTPKLRKELFKGPIKIIKYVLMNKLLTLHRMIEKMQNGLILQTEKQFEKDHYIMQEYHSSVLSFSRFDVLSLFSYLILEKISSRNPNDKSIH